MIKKPLVHIVILNWKSPQDTIECIKSLKKITYENYKIVLIDNNSNDGSVEKISEFLNIDAVNFPYQFCEIQDSSKNSALEISTNSKLLFVLNNENSGFAKGNNIGINIAINDDCDYVLLLNNDTIVTSDFLTILVNNIVTNPDYSALTPQIRFDERREYVWNCGGKLTWFGFWKKYYYDNSHINCIKDEGLIKDISFITGCALLFDPNELGKLTEDYFFGEEDFEFSLRLKNSKKQMGCSLNAVIYHKVGGSLKKVNTKGKRYINLLNRLINTRKNNRKILWPCFLIGALIFNFFILIIKEDMKLLESMRFSINLMTDAFKLNGVSQEKFTQILFKQKW